MSRRLRVPPISDRRAHTYVERLTLILLLLYGGNDWYTRLPLSIAAIAGLVVPALARAYGFWFFCGALALAGCARDWATADNHKYLIGYWCLAFALFHRDRDREGLARTARLLIGLCFLFAVIWKLRSPDYVSGDFFQFMLATDARFSFLARVAGGLDPAMHGQNRAALQALTFPGSELSMVRIFAGEARLAIGLTWFTIAIEALLAAAFLGPAASPLRRVRDPMLLVFAGATYLLAPVIGFGWVLLTMGLAQSDGDNRLMRWAYAAGFLLLLLYRSPWAQLLDQWLS